MSTKTTFKRIALVAVASLGLGMLSTGVSQAAISADAMTLGATASVGTTTAPVSTTVSITGISDANITNATATVALLAAPAASTNAGVLPTFSVTTTPTTGQQAVNALNNAVVTASAVGASNLNTITVAPQAAGRFTGVATLTMTPDAVGTYVYRITPGGVLNTTAQTWTVTVAAPTGATAAASRVYMRSGALIGAGQISPALLSDGQYHTVPSVTNGGTDVLTRSSFLTSLANQITAQDADAVNNVTTLNVSNANTAIGNTWANFGVIVANGTSLATSTITSAVQNTTTFNPSAAYPFTAAGFPVTVTVSGPGFITYEGAIRGKAFTEPSTAGQLNYLQRSFGLVSDGTFGTSTITFSQAGTVLATRTVVASGPLASYSAAVASKVNIGAGESGTLTVAGADAGGNVTPAPTVNAVSSNTAVATVAVANNVVTVTGVAVGSADISICNTAACTAATVSRVVKVTVTKTTAAKVTMTTDKADYAPGELITITVTATDSNGSAVADGSRALFTANSVTTSAALQGVLPAANVAIVGGKATYTVYAPLASGPVVISALEGTGTDSTTKAAVSVSFTVSADPVVQAAADAAAEATDAANAATDAANAAAEAADAATAAAQDAADAVAALSTEVAAMITALKKQITALTNLVIKIQKKVKA